MDFQLYNGNLLDIPENIKDDQLDFYAQGIAEELKRVHAYKLDKSIDWKNKIQSKIMLLMFNHGLLDNIGPKDYIIIDYLENNKFLLNDRNVTLVNIHKELQAKDFVFLPNQVEITNKDYETGDYVLDLIFLNNKKMAESGLSKIIVDHYFKDKKVMKFFKLLKFYTAIYLLESIVELNKEKSNKKEKYQEEINYLFCIYEDFSNEFPIWYKNNS